jgi:hypothetical protein
VSGSIPTGSNVLPISVAQQAGGFQNVAMASVTICLPGSASNCIKIDNLQVDTGSVGVRINASALNGLALPGVKNAGGNQAAECQTFATTSIWGSVRLADVTLGGETAHGIPIQVVSDPSIPSAPSDCSAMPNLAPGNGVIGIGYNQQDCGIICANSAQQYYGCLTSGSCGVNTLPVASQVANPVAAFSGDNNGVLFELPAVPISGASTVTGAVVFGIGTQSNNVPSGLTVIPVSSQVGTLTTTFNGATYPQSLVDSGTSFNTFADPVLAKCADARRYCPATTQTLGITLQSANGGASLSATFPIVNASQQAASGANYVAWSSDSTKQVVLGLPFFYGRTIAFGYTGANTSLGAGPFVAL